MTQDNKLPKSFYRNSDTVSTAKALLGCTVHSYVKGRYTSGIITETEAYLGTGDKACHAHQGRFTERTKIMYEPGGVAYIYLCYGIHHLFNIITNEKDHADAVLLRAIQPVDGEDIMMERRGKDKFTASLTAGPGNLTQALGIKKSMNGMQLDGDEVYLTGPAHSQDENITATTRIGINYAEEDALLPYRFYLTDSKFVSVR